mmetsp:Transcript_81257/g.252187  ORF Transcript_81257/g.252187 Transcript_81257/m.252187 type:complete len:218 (-) Transcript_81257:16-669(-)|eukprot:CAMPEP_0204571158 /NCGR_PEP_ID=MMETSP0661-20131031/38725_1 /ASSEMBLY_ACC=CAM_ASM_000606 /TAXON_ID=109239 /ORGANISM="Alexandrium margalefi, Strain AMGDE01CS-322" /LENGTH=217 /DNA_ID=CAMNT_0051579395 /DNA_START=39 /DNA_END=692 /DNA_ORIENTATION=+
MKRDHDHLFKLVLIGDSGAGKSSLLLRFADDTFTESYITTIGVDFRFKTIAIGKKSVKLQIWDTAGQERFRTITSAYYRGADAIVLVYDVTDRESFQHVDDWLADINRYVNQSTVKVLVGNKTDLEGERQVTTDEARKKAESLGLALLEASAKDSTNVEAAFQMISSELIARREQMGAQATAKAAGSTVNLTAGAAEPSSAAGRGLSCCAGGGPGFA